MIDKVLAGLARLRCRDAAPLSQGLSRDNAEFCLHAAVDAITRKGLEEELSTPGQRPRQVTLVCAYGVFTSPIEWVAMLLSAGCSVCIKAPARDPALCRALAEDMVAEGLCVSVSTDRDLAAPDAVIGMGDDASMVAIRRSTPNAIHALYGHRFSVALVTGDCAAAAPLLARDAALYDGRGCMAPTAVFTTADPEELARELATAFAQAEQRWPRGAFDSALGPEWRHRLGLARVMGMAHVGDAWAVCSLPHEQFLPAALPRMIAVHGIHEPSELALILDPWRHQLSTLGCDDVGAVPDLFPRVVTLGDMQIPRFPRQHDGSAMLGSITSSGKLGE